MLNFLGFILLIIGGVMSVPVPVAFFFNEPHLALVFAVPALVAIGLGFMLRRHFRPTELTLGKAMVIVTFTWILFSAFSSVPYVCGNNMSIEDAYFESMSGLTATGLTMIPSDRIATDLVISEVGVLAAPDNGFIELYNPTNSGIDLKNLHGGGENLAIWVTDENGNISSPSITWTNTVVPAHGYFLLVSGSIDNLASDASFSARLGNSGGVIIDDDSNPLDEAIDKVGWGSGSVENATEGTKVPNNLAAGDSIERKSWSLSTEQEMRASDRRKGNGYDTNKNSEDFVFHSGFHDPHNSLSPPEAPVKNIESTDKTILLWRSMTEWVGGMGIVVLFLSALVGFGKAARKMYVAEARTDRIEPSIRHTVRSLWKIYAILTVAGIIGLYVAGMPMFEAVNHSMTAIATGGFSVRNASFEGYSYPILVVAILIMMAGAISFAVHRKVMAGHFKELFRNAEVRFMLVLIIVATLLLVWSAGLSHSLFQTTSALTGTGFSTTNLTGWSDLQKGLLTVLMVIGGGYGSTSSAIKLIRIIIIGKAVYWMIKRSFLPERAVVSMKIAGREYSEQEMMETAIYAFIYLVVLMVGAVVLMTLGNSVMNSVFESASAQGNVGLSVGITSTVMPLAGKISLTAQMLVGRLEIIPVIAFLGYLVAKVPRPRPKPF